jgi:magnesium-transporting ATPase (P-type)
MYSPRVRAQSVESGIKSDYSLDCPKLAQYTTKDNVTNKCIFKISNEDLQLFFLKKNTKQPDNQGECKTALNILKNCGYNEGLCRYLNTDIETGIIGDKEDLERRRRIFGSHSIAIPEIQGFMTLLARNFEDDNVVFLIWSATIYLIFSVFSKRGEAYVESLTIYAGLLFSAGISAVCDWIKERQYLSLKDEINNQTITVFRGAHGTTS